MAKAQRVKFMKISLKDQPGTLLGLLQNLKSKNISLKALWGYGKQGADADLFVIAKETDKIKSAWIGSRMSVEEGTAFFFKGTDTAGALVKSLQALANANINIKAIHAVAVSGKYGSLMRVDAADVEKAAQALGAK